MANTAFDGKPYAGNPHVRIDEGDGASTKPRRSSLLFRTSVASCLVLTSLSLFAGDAIWTVENADYGTTLTSWTDSRYWLGGTPPAAGDNVVMTNFMTRSIHQRLPGSAFSFGSFIGWPGVTLDMYASGTIADATDFEGAWWIYKCGILTLGNGTVAKPGINRLHTMAGPRLSVAAESATATGVFGGGYLRKTGAGALELRAPTAEVTVFADQGELALGAAERGETIDVDALLATAQFHFDASVCDATTMELADGRVTKWKNLSGSNYAFPAYRTRQGELVPGPTWTADYQNGLGCLDFGPASTAANVFENGGAGLQFPRQAYVSAAFLVMADRDGVATTPVFGDPDDGRWARSSNGGIMYDNANMADGDLRVNGNRVDNFYQLNGEELKVVSLMTPTIRAQELGYPGGWRYAPMGGIAADGYSRFGGQRVGEMVLFTTKLTAAQFAAIDEYLRRKWLPASKAAKADYADVRLLDSADTLSVAEGESVRVRRLMADGGKVVKTGGGTLAIGRSYGDVTIEVRGGKVALGGGEAIDPSAPAASPKFHFDADSDDFVRDGANVTEWRDCRGSGYDKLVAVTSVKNPNGSLYFDTRLPTLEADALNGRPVVNFGSRYPINGLRDSYPSYILSSSSGARLASSLSADPGDTVREIFYVARQTETHAYPLSSVYSYNFFHGDGGELVHRDLAASALLGAKWTKDGVPVDPSAEKLGTDFHLFRLSAVGRKVHFDSVFLDRLDSNLGGGKIAEIIAYDRELTDKERIDTEAYLLKKWFDRPHPAATGTIRLEYAGDAPAEIDSEGEFALGEVASGSGELVKDGAGALSVDSLAGVSRVEVRAGSLAVTPVGDLLGRAAFRVDPSDETTMTLADDGYSADSVSAWRDANGGDMVATAIDSCGRMPTLWRNYSAANNRNVVAFGKRTEWAYRAGTSDATGRGMNWNRRLTNVKECYFVFGDYPGDWRSLFFLTDTDSYDFHRQDYGGLWNETYASVYLRKGWMMLDNILLDPGNNNQYDLYPGRPINSYTVPTPTPMHLYSIAITNEAGSVRAGSFANDRSSNVGGAVMGEYVIYTNSLTAAQRELVRDYLLRKWRDLDAGTKHYESVTVGAGARASLPELEVSVGAFEIGCGAAGIGRVDFDGALDLSAPGTITIRVGKGTAPVSAQPVVTAARGVIGSLDGWTTVVEGGNYGAKLSVANVPGSEAQAIVLTLCPPGFILLVR